jgi:hypothetical protein
MFKNIILSDSRLILLLFLVLFITPCYSVDAKLKILGVSFTTKELKEQGKTSSKEGNKVKHQETEVAYSVVWMKIQGTGFSLQPQDNQLLIDNWKIPVIKVRSDEILAIVPFNVPIGKHKLTITTNAESDNYEINLENRTDKLNFPAEQENNTSISIYDPKENMMAQSSANYIITTSQDLNKLKSKAINQYYKNKISDNIELITMKLIKPIPDIASSVEKTNYLEKRNHLLSSSDISTTYSRATLLVGALIHGKNAITKPLTNLEVLLTLRDANGLIEFEKPLKTILKPEIDNHPFDNYEVISYFLFPLPDRELFAPLEIELQLNSPDIKNPIKLSKTLKVKNIAPTLSFYRSFLHAKKDVDFISNDDKYFEMSADNTITTGQHVALVNLFSVNGFTNISDNIQCNLDVENKKKVIIEKFTTNAKIGNAFKAYCAFDFFASDKWLPGDYVVSPLLKAESNKVITKGDKFKITVLPYKPDIKMNSWIVSPVKLESLKYFGSERDQRMLLLANGLAFANKKDRVGLLAYIEATGFPPSTEPDNKHNISYSFTFQDSAGHGVKISGETKLDKINGASQLYRTMPIPEQLVSGQITVTVEISIDNIKIQSQNGFLMY